MAKDTSPDLSEGQSSIDQSFSDKPTRIAPQTPGNPHDLLREQFFLNVDVQRLFGAHPDDDARRLAVSEQLDIALQNRTSWRNAYHAEQLLVGLMDQDKLVLEAERRLAKTDHRAPSNTAIFRSELADLKQAGFSDVNKLRHLVLRIVSDNQWRRMRRMLERRFAAAYVNRVNFIWIVCTLCFLFSVVLIDWLPSWLFSASTPTAPVFVPPEAGDVTLAPLQALTPADAASLVQPRVDLLRLSGLWLALFTGLLGASFSMIAMAQRRLRRLSLEELQLQSRWEFLLLRLGFGSGAAVILYFAFQANLVEGALFPNLVQIGVLENKPTDGVPWGSWVPNASLAALMVWSFIAGFSENFVPNFLRKVDEPDKDDNH